MKRNRAVVRTERGWAGHLIVCERCRFRRNTLLMCNYSGVVVSTVGNFWERREDKGPTEIGIKRHYETMVFRAGDPPYFDAETSIQISCSGKSSLLITKANRYNVDNLANEMHESVVEEMKDRLRDGDV